MRLVAYMCLMVMSCSEAEPRFSFEGPINAEFVKLLSEMPDESTLALSSGGGYASPAIEAAELIEKKNIALHIDKYCLSACVDFLFPAAHKVSLVNKPVVGLHGNPVSDLKLFTAAERDGDKDCIKEEAERLQALWDRRNVTIDIGLETAERLRPILGPGQNCASVTYLHSFWLPTANQLREVYGSKIVGATCSDDPVCVNTFIRYRWKSGTVVVGDRVFAVDGTAVKAPAW